MRSDNSGGAFPIKPDAIFPVKCAANKAVSASCVAETSTLRKQVNRSLEQEVAFSDLRCGMGPTVMSGPVHDKCHRNRNNRLAAGPCRLNLIKRVW